MKAKISPIILTAGTIFTLSTGVYFLVATFNYTSTILQGFLGIAVPTCGCETLFLFSSHPFLYSALLILTFITLYSLVTTSIHIVRNLYRTKMLLLSLQSLAITSSNIQLKDNMCVDVQLIESNDFFAFCAGVFQPTIWISSKTQHTLSESDLEAVLYHEAMHIHRFHVLQRLIIDSWIRSLPLTRSFRTRLLQSIESIFEQNADHGALAYTRRESLLRACITFIEQKEETKNGTPIHATATQAFSTQNERVQALLLQPVFNTWKFIFLFFAITAFFIIVLFWGTTIPANAASTRSSDPSHAAYCMQAQEQIRSEARYYDISLQTLQSFDFSHQCLIPTMSIDPQAKINYLQ